EHIGRTYPEDGTPYSQPVIYNATFIGQGLFQLKRLITFKDNSGGHYHNSIFMNQTYGVSIENKSSGEDSYNRFLNGDLSIRNNVFYEVALSGTNATPSHLFDVDGGNTSEISAFRASFNIWNNTIADPGITYSPLNPIPVNSGNISGGVVSTDSFFDGVTYQGAFDPTGNNWAN